jgi:2-(1,2-epoxy-1,2-dihydrophenyl)acetyl-CoA isomerase
MNYETVTMGKEGGVVILTLNRQDVFNAINSKMAEEAEAIIREVAEDDATRVLIITGAGRGFCSGIDVSDLAAATERPLMETVIGRIMRGEASVFSVPQKVRSLDKPVIAAINGVTIGAGLCLALACDIRIASEDARLGTMFIKRGLIPDCGGTYFMAQLIGTAKACELAFTGDMITAAEAEQIGLVNRVVPKEALMKEAKELGNRIAKNPPLALKLTKQAIYKAAVEPDFMSHMNYEIYCQNLLLGTEDFKEALRAFSEKREPMFKGR